MKHALEEASATVRRCHIFGRGEAICSIPVWKEVSVVLSLDRELCTQTTCRLCAGLKGDVEMELIQAGRTQFKS
jgi:hypothetical protein